MVDPTIASKTVGNCHIASRIIAWRGAVRYRMRQSFAVLETGDTLAMPENLRVDLLTVRKMRSIK